MTHRNRGPNGGINLLLFNHLKQIHFSFKYRSEVKVMRNISFPIEDDPSQEHSMILALFSQKGQQGTCQIGSV